jgi:hypothetical protein
MTIRFDDPDGLRYQGVKSPYTFISYHLYPFDSKYGPSIGIVVYPNRFASCILFIAYYIIIGTHIGMSADKPCFFPFSLPKEYASIVEEARTHGIYFKEATITDDPDMQSWVPDGVFSRSPDRGAENFSRPDAFQTRFAIRSGKYCSTLLGVSLERLTWQMMSGNALGSCKNA